MKKNVYLILVLIILTLVPFINVKAKDNSTNYLSSNTYLLAASHDDNQSAICETYDATIGKYWKWVVMLAPVATMLLISIDFLKAIVASKMDDMKKASTNAIKRMTALVVLLFLPYVLALLFDLVGITNCF